MRKDFDDCIYDPKTGRPKLSTSAEVLDITKAKRAAEDDLRSKMSLGPLDALAPLTDVFWKSWL